MTLIEVTVVIAVLLGLITVLAIGLAAYKNGTDRAICVQNIGMVQKAMRSYCNINGKFPGDTVTALQDQIIGPNKFLEAVAPCPGNGTYTFTGDTIVDPGVLFMSCDIPNH